MRMVHNLACYASLQLSGQQDGLLRRSLGNRLCHSAVLASMQSGDSSSCAGTTCV